ncbi:MAG: hypothetical protein JJU20_10570 [Opitutales bacterium]|nr:hypothetical protein [Opitutales bacterium]
MKFNLRKFAGLSLAGFALAAGISAHAGDKALLDALVENNVLTRAQADEIRGKAPTLVTPNRGIVTELKIRGRIQGQFAYADGSNSNTAAAATDYSTMEIRRTRLGVQGRIFDDWRFMVEANVLSTTDLDGAVLTYAANPEAQFTVGKAKPRFGHEENTSSASILTMERSRLTGLFNGGKPIGVRVHGAVDNFSYYAGLFNGASTSTSRMGSGNDSYLWNASVGYNMSPVRLRLDYLHSTKASGYYRFEDAFAFSAHYNADQFDLRAELMRGSDHASNKIRGWYVMPSYFFTPGKLQGVLRYEQVKGDAGVNLGANRYAADVPGIYRSGNRYNALYAGINYYISGDNLKLMAGIERAENYNDAVDPEPKGKTTTLISGVRMQF